MWGKWYNFMENQLGWSPHGARHWIQLTLTASGFLWRFFLRWEHPRLRQMQWKISKFHQLFVTELPQLPFGITNDTRQVFVIGGVSVLRVPRAKKQWDTPPEPRRKLNSSCKAKKNNFLYPSFRQKISMVPTKKKCSFESGNGFITVFRLQNHKWNGTNAQIPRKKSVRAFYSAQHVSMCQIYPDMWRWFETARSISTRQTL